ncbi:MAG TPA: antitoxin [Solirubrobacteraceae bacterium]
MGLTDRLKDVAKKAEDAAAERKVQIRDAVHKAGTVADERTGGKYSEQIQKAGAKADSVVDRIKDPEAPDAAPEPPPGPSAVD